MTAVFDYGPLDDLTKGFQVQYSSRFTNSAGGVKELYYSNGGMLDMDKQTVTPTGGLTARSAAEMKMQPNLLPSFSLVEKAEKMQTDADTGGRAIRRPAPTCATGWSACARRKTAECEHPGGLQPLDCAVHVRGRGADRREGYLRRQDAAGGRGRQGPCLVCLWFVARGVGVDECAPMAAGAQKGVVVKADEAAHRVDVTINGTPFTSYLWDTNQRKPVLYPLIAPDGTTVTRGYPFAMRPGERVDHPHHAGLWFNYGNANGFDFWNNSDAIPVAQRPKYGTITHDRIVSVKSGKDAGELTVESTWTTGAGRQDPRADDAVCLSPHDGRRSAGAWSRCDGHAEGAEPRGLP
jgi:hypothetical protein